LSLRHAHTRFATRYALYLSLALSQNENFPAQLLHSLYVASRRTMRRRFRHHRRVPTAVRALHLLNRFRSPSQNSASLPSLILASAFPTCHLSSPPPPVSTDLVIFLIFFSRAFSPLPCTSSSVLYIWSNFNKSSSRRVRCDPTM